MPDMMFVPPDAPTAEPTDNSVVKVTAEGPGKGEETWYLPPEARIEIADDGPNHITVEALDREQNKTEHT
jgi:hypothetical protein